ncbi:hypothetical protein AV530_017001 [Patagioenas fasciata monilis]|uniref:Uncharacterized protein n=1 Tax=Patagioenas fasciata monilis TaxID=372326 RepID=A0A1V4J507_PATFA|nr:hypothetical protein AV530_017001 [Patagioenas fasciata monilis]
MRHEGLYRERLPLLPGANTALTTGALALATMGHLALQTWQSGDGPFCRPCSPLTLPVKPALISPEITQESNENPCYVLAPVTVRIQVALETRCLIHRTGRKIPQPCFPPGIVLPKFSCEPPLTLKNSRTKRDRQAFVM